MKIHVTGCSGFLGSHLIDALAAEGHELFGNDTFIGSDEANIPDAVRNKFYGEDLTRFNPIDCRDRKRIYGQLAHSRPDVLFHCAALAHEGLSVFSPSLISDSILGASASVFSAAIAAGVKRIVFMSSMARYGGGFVDWDGNHLGVPFKEDENEPRPVDPYGICKVAAEDMLRMLCKTHGVEYVIAVPHNLYGERQSIDPYRNVATIFANRMLLGQQPIIYGDGEQQRTFSYVGDAVPSLVRMATQSNVIGEVINIGPDEEVTTINELARMIAEIIGFDLKPIYMPGRPAEVRFATCSADKARRLLGYKTDTLLKDGLPRLVADLKKRGPRPFDYKLPVEIVSDLTPRTWVDKLI